MNHSTLRKGMLHTAAEGGEPRPGATTGDEGVGEGDLGVGEEGGGGSRGEGGGGRKWGGTSVPRVPNPKLIPKWDGVHGVPGDAHLHSDVSGVCRGPSCVLEALWRNGRVHIYY